MRADKLSMCVITSVLTINACSNTPPCEDILEVKQQTRQCKQLQKTLATTKNPVQALLVRSRFEKECENLRYYRDDYDTICKGDQTPVGKRNKE